MHILHTEGSNGWGGQEIRILREAEGMRARGHEVIFAVTLGGKLIAHARKLGFQVYELNFKKTHALFTIPRLLRIFKKHRIDLVNTHSSSDAWMAGIAARLAGKFVVRTRHLSTPIRKGLNSVLLYNGLSDFVVTTSSAIVPLICNQSKLPPSQCRCIPTGVDPAALSVDPLAVKAFREQLHLRPDDCLVGTACFVRSWKGINDFMRAAELLREIDHLKWIVVGGGYVNDYKIVAEKMDLKGRLIFTGHLNSPYTAIAAMDVFALLSTAHEGISQSTLQAAYLKKPLITTPIGGLPEVCIDGKTGLIVPTFSPEKVGEAVINLMNSAELRKKLGEEAHRLVLEKFTMQHTLDGMESVYSGLFS